MYPVPMSKRQTSAWIGLGAVLAAAGTGCGGGVDAPTYTGPADTAADATPADINPSLAAVDFGPMAIGSAANKLLDIQNLGGSSLTVDSITIDPPFAVSSSALTVAPGGAQQLTISAVMNEYADYAVELVIHSDDQDEPELRIPVTAAAIRDADGDGHDIVAAGGDDCDDTDADVYPGATETWYDGVDADCDGASDYDRDGDGYEAETDTYQPDEPDCQDLRAEIHPGAEDPPYDGVDSNCDGKDDYDVDGDGSQSAAEKEGGLDCNDFDPEVNIAGTEQLNGQDDDCDGESDDGAAASESEFVYDAEGGNDRFGYALAIGDLDADGCADLLASSPWYGATSGAGRGTVSVFEGCALPATGSTAEDATHIIEGASSTDLLGAQLAVLGDFDGDGENDAAMAATGYSSQAGAVYLLYGDDLLAGRADTSDAFATFVGSGTAALGQGIATDVDLDGDGIHDLVAAYSDGGTNAVAIEYGGTYGAVSIANMDARITASGSEAAFYRNAPAGGDFDGDGRDDLLLSDGTADDAATDGGACWMTWGDATRLSGTYAIASVATTIAAGTSASAGYCWASQLGEDWDEDDDAELWVYVGGSSSHALYVVEGEADRRSAIDPTTSYAVRYDWGSYADVEMLRRSGDWTMDGVSDMLAFVEDDDSNYGRVYGYGTELRTGSRDAADDRIAYGKGTSDNDNDNFGFGMAALHGDLDGDGDGDFAIGDPGQGDDAGQVYVIINEAHE
jgi:hypothetical protein